MPDKSAHERTPRIPSREDLRRVLDEDDAIPPATRERSPAGEPETDHE